MNIPVIIEEGRSSYGAYSPIVPGCAALGKTREEVLYNMRKALESHFKGLRENGLPLTIPPFESLEGADSIEVAIPE